MKWDSIVITKNKERDTLSVSFTGPESVDYPIEIMPLKILQVEEEDSPDKLCIFFGGVSQLCDRG